MKVPPLPHRRVDPQWGESTFGPHRVTQRGQWLWMHQGPHRTYRFYNRRGEQVGPEQPNLTAACAASIEAGWKTYRGINDAGRVWVPLLERDLLGDLQIILRNVDVHDLCEDCGETHSILACKEIVPESPADGDAEFNSVGTGRVPDFAENSR